MENVNSNVSNINVVSIPLSDYNTLQSNLSDTRDLLAKATTELEVLKSQSTTDASNSVIVYEKRKIDRWGNEALGATEKLILNVEDPTASAKLLDIISKVETSELTDQIKAKTDEIKALNKLIEQHQDSLDRIEKNHARRLRDISEDNEEKIKKLKRLNDEKLEAIETDKVTIEKALADLKKDKTQQQIELARSEEIAELNKKIDALENFKARIDSLSNDPKELKKFMEGVRASQEVNQEYPWINKLWANVNSAISRVESFVELLKSVGKTKKDCPKADHVYYHHVDVCDNCDCECDSDDWR